MPILLGMFTEGTYAQRIWTYSGDQECLRPHLEIIRPFHLLFHIESLITDADKTTSNILFLNIVPSIALEWKLISQNLNGRDVSYKLLSASNVNAVKTEASQYDVNFPAEVFDYSFYLEDHYKDKYYQH